MNSRLSKLKVNRVWDKLFFYAENRLVIIHLLLYKIIRKLSKFLQRWYFSKLEKLENPNRLISSLSLFWIIIIIISVAYKKIYIWLGIKSEI